MTRKVRDDSLGFRSRWNNTWGWGEVGDDADFTKGVSTKEDGCGDYGLVGLHG